MLLALWTVEILWGLFLDVYYIFWVAENQFLLVFWRTFWDQRPSNAGRIWCCRRPWILWQILFTAHAARMWALKIRTTMYSAVTVFSASAVYAFPHGMLVQFVWPRKLVFVFSRFEPESFFSWCFCLRSQWGRCDSGQYHTCCCWRSLKMHMTNDVIQTAPHCFVVWFSLFFHACCFVAVMLSYLKYS
jgi:hypothetical protein